LPGFHDYYQRLEIRRYREVFCGRLYRSDYGSKGRTAYRETIQVSEEENLDPKDQGHARYITSEGMIEFSDNLGKLTPTEQLARFQKALTIQKVTNS